MSLLYNMLSRLVIAFLPKSKHLLISWQKSSSEVILQPKKINPVNLSIVSPSIYNEDEGTKKPLDESERREWKSWLKTQHSFKKMKIMASSPITSWQIDGETMETMTDFIFLGSIITADGDCSHEIKTRLLLGRKAITNLDSTLKVETLLCWQRSS